MLIRPGCSTWRAGGRLAMRRVGGPAWRTPTSVAFYTAYWL